MHIYIYMYIYIYIYTYMYIYIYTYYIHTKLCMRREPGFGIAREISCLRSCSSVASPAVSSAEHGSGPVAAKELLRGRGLQGI